MAETQTPLWTPSEARKQAAVVTRFMTEVNTTRGAGATDFTSLWEWSVADPEAFWDAVWDFCGVIGDKGSDRILADGDKMPGAKFFPDARVNFAENLLRRRDGADAIVFWGETEVRRRMSFAELYDATSRLSQALKAAGVGPGDRVAANMPNMPETIIAMLAATALGAIFSSCSPDFGAQGVLDRFGQIEPKVLVTCDGYFYNGKSFDQTSKIAEVVGQIPSIETVVVVPYTRERAPIDAIRGAVHYTDFIAGFEAGDIDFAPMPFNDPLYIMFSSGTTGVPKCIVHGIGGTLLQHLKEHQLHSDVRRDDRVFYFTTCGWMMWNWLVSGLASEATLLLYDGSPFHPSGEVLFDLAQAEGMRGWSRQGRTTCRRSGRSPRPALRWCRKASTGSTAR
jgi:acetoacetyl-CoA synthetase